MPNHFTLTFFFAVRGAMYHVAIATVIFSHVKIIIMFLHESSPGISLVFTYNKIYYLPRLWRPLIVKAN